VEIRQIEVYGAAEVGLYFGYGQPDHPRADHINARTQICTAVTNVG